MLMVDTSPLLTHIADPVVYFGDSESVRSRKKLNIDYDVIQIVIRSLYVNGWQPSKFD